MTSKEIEAGKHLQTQLDEGEKHRVQLEGDCMSLQTQLAEEKVKVSDREAANKSLQIDNTRLRSTLTNAERQIEELSEKPNDSGNEDSSNPVFIQLNDQLKDKQDEVTQLKETLELSEKALSEARINWKEEAKAGKHLQGLLNEEKNRKVQLEEECTSLQTQLSEEKIKLQRSRSLLQLSKSDNQTMVDQSIKNPVPTLQVEAGDKRLTGLRIPDAVVEANSAKLPCIFEIVMDGACTRKEKCKFDHELASSLRNDSSEVCRILTETSSRIGKCAFEMTKKGSCPGEDTCNVPHATARPSSSAETKPRRICFRELMEKDSLSRREELSFLAQDIRRRTS